MRLPDLRAQFDDRAARYSRSHWHTDYAAGLVDCLDLEPGATVLDAGAGTGMATRAIARGLGRAGRVVAVDISPGMTRHQQVGEPAISGVIADATRLPLPDSSVDAVVCGAALLYMPVRRALAEWHRVLRAGGRVAFSSMRAGHPPAAELFRALARARGARLSDPSAALGSEGACTAALEEAGFRGIDVRASTVRFTQQDLDEAWAVHERVYRDQLKAALGDLRAFEREYRTAMKTGRDQLAVAHVLYAIGIKG